MSKPGDNHWGSAGPDSEETLSKFSAVTGLASSRHATPVRSDVKPHLAHRQRTPNQQRIQKHNNQKVTHQRANDHYKTRQKTTNLKENIPLKDEERGWETVNPEKVSLTERVGSRNDPRSMQAPANETNNKAHWIHNQPSSAWTTPPQHRPEQPHETHAADTRGVSTTELSSECFVS
jgi:hypothetical protein